MKEQKYRNYKNKFILIKNKLWLKNWSDLGTKKNIYVGFISENI